MTRRPVIKFDALKGREEPGRPVLELETSPDRSPEARFARFEESRRLWAQVIGGADREQEG